MPRGFHAARGPRAAVRGARSQRVGQTPGTTPKRSYAETSTLNGAHHALHASSCPLLSCCGIRAVAHQRAARKNQVLCLVGLVQPLVPTVRQTRHNLPPGASAQLLASCLMGTPCAHAPTQSLDKFIPDLLIFWGPHERTANTVCAVMDERGLLFCSPLGSATSHAAAAQPAATQVTRPRARGTYTPG